MSASHKWTFALKRDEKTTSQAETAAPTSSVETALEVSLANGATNTNYALAWTNSKLQSLLILADKNVTLKTNNSTTPATTVALLANVPLVWLVDWATWYPNPFAAANVTTTYWTNASGAAANIKLYALSTP